MGPRPLWLPCGALWADRFGRPGGPFGAAFALAELRFQTHGAILAQVSHFVLIWAAPPGRGHGVCFGGRYGARALGPPGPRAPCVGLLGLFPAPWAGFPRLRPVRGPLAPLRRGPFGAPGWPLARPGRWLWGLCRPAPLLALAYGRVGCGGPRLPFLQVTSTSCSSWPTGCSTREGLPRSYFPPI